MKKFFKVPLIALLSLTLLAGCSGTDNSKSDSADAQDKYVKIEGAKTYDGKTIKADYPKEYEVIDSENLSTFFDDNSGALSELMDKSTFDKMYKSLLNSVDLIAVNVSNKDVLFLDNFNVIAMPAEGNDVKEIIQGVYDDNLDSILGSLKADLSEELKFEKINGREVGQYQFKYSMGTVDIIGTQFSLVSNDKLLVITLTTTTTEGIEDFKNSVVASIEYK